MKRSKNLMKMFVISTLLSLAIAGAGGGGGAISLAAIFDSTKIAAHISFLAHDSLEGRKVGSAGEKIAAAYIQRHFEELGLKPAASDGSFQQTFEFTADIVEGESNSLSIGGRELELGVDFRPLRSSGSGEFSFEEMVYVGFGIENDSMDHHDYADKDVSGKAVLISRYSPDGNQPHGAYSVQSGLDAKMAEASKRGASGIFFFTPEDQDDTLPRMSMKRFTARDFPVVFLKRSVFGDEFPTPEKLVTAKFAGEVDLVRVKKNGVNVLATVTGGGENNEGRYVIVGAHFDHLGWGGKGSGSLYAGDEPQIHNGADDNASGTSGVLELARYFNQKRAELDYNLIFLAFSGEESGLLGSNYFVKNPSIDMEKAMFMVNLDMIGRLDPEKGLSVMGVGTTPVFKEYFDNYEGDFKVSTKESGAAPSDNTAFYNHGMPVLFFFTGSHKDYHKPSDDAELVDNEGVTAVLEFVAERIENFAAEPEKIIFTKTKDAAPGKSPRFTVTLGVMPDYLWEEKGLRIDGVTTDRPADLAGLLAGDIVVELGDYPIDDIYAYMAALASFRKGDSTTVVVDRDGEKLTMDLVF